VRVVRLALIGLAGCLLQAAYAGIPSGNSVNSNLRSIEQSFSEKQSLTEAQLKYLNSIVESNPDNALAHFLLGRFYEKSNYGTIAAEEYDKARQLDPANPIYLVSLSQVKLLLGEAAEATKLAELAVQRFPDNYQALVTAGILMQRQNRNSKAEEYYRRALKLRSGSAEVASVRADSLYKQGHYAAALAEANQALSANKRSFLAHATKGKILLLVREKQAALSNLQAAFDLNPFNVEIAKLYAKTSIELGQPQNALKPALLILPTTIEDPKQLLRAKNFVKRYLPVMPQDASRQAVEEVGNLFNGTKYGALYYFCMGDIYDRLHKPYDAMHCYKLGLERDPNYARGYLRLGIDMEEVLHDYQGSLAMYKKAYQLLPQDPEIVLRHNSLVDRLPIARNDLAWRLKDWLQTKTQKL
jgi:tetratricopeptide (TPR) repeat protein